MMVDRFNVSMDDVNHFKKVKRSHQWIQLIYGRRQIHMQELEDQADFIPMGEEKKKKQALNLTR